MEHEKSDAAFPHISVACLHRLHALLLKARSATFVFRDVVGQSADATAVGAQRGHALGIEFSSTTRVQAGRPI